MMRSYWRWTRGWLSELRRLTDPRAAQPDGDTPRLDAVERSWLLQDFREDLGWQIENGEERGIIEWGRQKRRDLL